MIDLKTIEKAVYDLCVQANTILPDCVFNKLLQSYEAEQNFDAKQTLGLILKNAQLANKKKMPLCQDTGQVLVFAKGNSFPVGFKNAIQKGVETAYEKNYYRKSVVKNAVFNRENTKTNTPCIIYTEVSDNNEDIEFQILLKGGGSENVCKTEMLSPTATEDEIAEFVVSVVKKAGAKACPPYFIGVGIGGTMEYAGLLSKKALLLDENIDENHKNLAEKIKKAANDLDIGAAGFGGISTVLDVKLLTDFTHIACMPVAVTINCHSSRHAKCIINEKGEVKSEKKIVSQFNVHNSQFNYENFIPINTSDIDKLKTLKKGQNVLLSGEIYTARDMAHKRLVKMIENGEELPFDLQNKIIFYAGPCPCPSESVVGSIGPTTAERMDKFASKLYEKGVIATIGKGERSEDIKIAVKKVGGLYFTVVGGIACFLAERFVSKELIAFEDLGTEAIYRFEVKDLPLNVNCC